jgi:hypothetical protein
MATAAFVATLSLVDHTTGPLRQIANNIASVGRRIRAAGAGMVRTEAMVEARHHLHSIGHAFHGIEGAANGAVAAVGKFLPAIGALGAGGSLTALVSLTKSVADSRHEMIRTQEKLGLTAQQFAPLKGAAKVAGLDVDTLTGGLVRLNRAMALTTSGKNKELVALFQHIGISRAQLSHMNVADTFKALSDAFAKTSDAAMRTRVAMLLFGKSGAELIPILAGGSAEIEAMAKQLQGLTYSFTAADDQALQQFRVSWLRVETAVAGVRNEIGARLAPILAPIIDKIATWIGQNREFIATSIAGKVETLAKALGDLWEVARKIDWNQPLAGLAELGSKLWDLTGNVEGAHLAIGGFLLLMGSPLIVAVTSAVTAIGTVAMAIRAIGLLMLTNPLGLVITAIAAVGVAAYELYQHWDWVRQQMQPVADAIMTAWRPVEAFFVAMWAGIVRAFDAAWSKIEPIVRRIVEAAQFIGRQFDFSGDGGGAGAGGPVAVPRLVAPPEVPRVQRQGGEGFTPLRLGPPGGGAGGGGGAPVANTGTVDVTVRLENAPPGTTEAATAGGIANTPSLDVGHAWAGAR